jgi:hypothetical protein
MLKETRITFLRGGIFLLLLSLLILPLCACSRRAEQKLVGKWQRTETGWDAFWGGGPKTYELEFFPDGSFSLSVRKADAESAQAGAGRYTFPDPTHIRLDFSGPMGSGTSIHEIVALTNEELRLRAGDEMEVWTRVGAPQPALGTMSQNEAAAVGSLRTINTAEVVYASTYGLGYSKTLSQLGPPPGTPNADAAKLLDRELASGTKNGYMFTYRAGPSDAQGKIKKYTVVARPTAYGRTGHYSFFTDQSGVIRGTSRDREATANDPTPPQAQIVGD